MGRLRTMMDDALQRLGVAGEDGFVIAALYKFVDAILDGRPIDVYNHGDMYRDFGIGPYDAVDWAKIVDEMLNAELQQQTPLADIPEAQARRDRKLMALMHFKTTQEKVG